MPSHAFMRAALVAARRGAGRTHPNPSVGAVVHRRGEILGRGTTRRPGGPHAEVVAIEAALRAHGSRALRGAELAVTLEPCCFEGRTGPCTRAIIEAGIRSVQVGCRDPHERVSGRGLRALRRAGIEVETGVLKDECREHHRGFISLCERGRPFVTLKLASTLDGRIATATGESRWITGPEARAMVHRLRARTDAVMVGSGTALADDPELTARRGDRVVARPIRVLVDSKLRLSPRAKLYSDGGNTWVLTRESARGRRARRATGAQLLDVPSVRGHLDLAEAMQILGDRGLTTLLVEGGGQLAAALLRANLVDEIHWVLAPSVIGEEGRAAVGSLAIERLHDAPGFEVESTRRLGRDIHITARIRSGEAEDSK